MEINIKRIYEQPDKKDGFRIYVEKHWPGDINMFETRIDLWLKDIAPSNRLKDWVCYDGEQVWEKYKEKYFLELDEKPQIIEKILNLPINKVTLVYSLDDPEYDHVIVLKEYLDNYVKNDRTHKN